MREKFGVVSQSEIHNKQQIYRFWTHSMHPHHPSKSFSDNQKLLHEENGLSTQSGDLVPNDWPLGSNSKGELLVSEKTEVGQESKTHSSSCHTTSEVIESEQGPVDGEHEDNLMSSDLKYDEVSRAPESHVSPSTSLQPLSMSSIPIPKTQKYTCRSSTLFAAQREQRILEKLKVYQFPLHLQCI